MSSTDRHPAPHVEGNHEERVRKVIILDDSQPVAIRRFIGQLLAAEGTVEVQIAGGDEVIKEVNTDRIRALFGADSPDVLKERIKNRILALAATPREPDLSSLTGRSWKKADRKGREPWYRRHAKKPSR
jgi:hypothetical protein